MQVFKHTFGSDMSIEAQHEEPNVQKYMLENYMKKCSDLCESLHFDMHTMKPNLSLQQAIEDSVLNKLEHMSPLTAQTVLRDLQRCEKIFHRLVSLTEGHIHSLED